MELVKKQGDGCTEFYFKDGLSEKPIIIINKGAVPYTWSHERTARTIEKMEEMEAYVYDDYCLRAGGMGQSSPDFEMRWPLRKVKKLLDFIENGDKEEMVWCIASEDGTINKSNFRQIPKTEAKRLNLID